MDLARELDQVAAFLEAAGYRWALIGGLAMQAYGLCRATQDVDFVVEATARDAVVAFMESQDYETLHASASFSNHLHRDTGRGRVDFAYVDDVTSDKLQAAARTVVGLHGRPLLVPSPEHLIAMKVHAARNDPTRTLREMTDIEHLLRQPGVRRGAVRRHFEAAGLLRWYDELTRLA